MPREHGPAWAHNQWMIEQVLFSGKSTRGTLLGPGKGWKKREKCKPKNKPEHYIAKNKSCESAAIKYKQLHSLVQLLKKMNLIYF